MSAAELILWYAAVLLGLAGSAMFSGLETGIYTLNRVRLHVLAHTPRSNAAVLERLIDRPNRLLGTLLVGNNIANYAASLAIAALLDQAGYRGWSQVAINAAILTPMLFIFGEVLPKDFFRSHTNRLTYSFARPLRWLQRLLTWTGPLPLIDGVSWLLGRLLGAGERGADMLHPRRVMTRLMKESVGHGLITPYQSDMIDRVLQMGRLRVRDVMTEWAGVTAARTSQPPEAVWALADRVPYTRLPLLDRAGEPIGLLDVADVLMHEPERCPPLQELARPLARIQPDASCRAALLTLQQHRTSMALVIENHRPIGLVTTKNLVEPIVGELDVW